MDALRIERDDDVLRITLARPETRNAFDATVIGELAEAFVDVGKARAVVLAGDGPSFCAGADVEWMRGSIALTLEENVADAMALRRMLEAIDTCPAPVIALVQGHALGGGAGLVATADIAVAHERAVFGFSEVKLGITPAVISPFALRKIGESAARRYFVTGERFDAPTASPNRARARGRRRPRSSARRPARRVAHRGAARGPAREAPRSRPPGRARDGAKDRRAAHERGRAGRPERVRRAATATLVAGARARRVTALLALTSAIFIGGADFIGGMTSRTVNGVQLACLVAFAGLPMALAVSLVVDTEQVSSSDVAWSVAAGSAVALGLGCFYVGMGRGLISVVAPVAAVTGAVIPVVYALARGERPGPIALIGLGIAFVAVAVVSLAPSEQHPGAAVVDRTVIALALVSGALFGLFYIAFSRVSEDAGMWPLTIERAACAVVLLGLALLLTRDVAVDVRRLLPKVLVIALLEVAATIPLLLALQRGPIAIATVVASLYPVTTVLLAAFVLRERLSRLQYVGVVCALLSVALVSSG